MNLIEFGEKTRRDHYVIDQDLVYVNHGSYGPCPRIVLEELQRLRFEQEQNPDHWFRLTKYTQYVNNVRQAADRLDCDFEQITLVDNATVGANAIIKSAKPGGSILCTNLGYGAVLFTVEEAAKQRNMQVRMIDIRFPIESKQAFVQQFKDELNKGDTENIRLAVIDHITSSSAVLVPIEELTDLLHSYNIPVLVDGAHGPGQVSPNLSSRGLKCDYYIGTFHKWMYAARGCSFLFVRDPIIANELQPGNTSWGYRSPAAQLALMTHFHLQFFHQGTRDESAHLTLLKAIEFADSYAGGFERIHQYNSNLSQQAKTYLEQRWNTEGNDIAPIDMHAPYLKMIRLPDLNGYEKNEEDALRLALYLMEHHKLISMTMCVNNELYVRISTQIHNRFEDYQVLAEKIDELRKK